MQAFSDMQRGCLGDHHVVASLREISIIFGLHKLVAVWKRLNVRVANDEPDEQPYSRQHEAAHDEDSSALRHNSTHLDFPFC